MTWLALGLWPFISGALFWLTRLPVAVTVTLIGGYLLLPTRTSFDLPIFPALDKNTIPALTALLFTIFQTSRRSSAESRAASWPVQDGWLPRNRMVLFFLICLVLGNIATVAVNGDPISYGPLTLPGLEMYDAMSAMLSALMMLIPFLLARKLLANVQGQRVLLEVIVIAACAYSLLALYEVRMSPQLNRMVYGFFPHSWAQHFRGGGWRPLVFLPHGLDLAIFLAVSIISSFGLFKTAPQERRWTWALAGLWLAGTLILAKSLGALVIAVLMLGIMIALPRRLQIVAAISIVLCVLTYPTLRAAGWIPVERVLSAAESVSPERAESLKWRFDNENILLEKANERPWLGWGGWGRSRVYSEQGTDISTTDGKWVIELGLGGWVRYIGTFGLLSWGILAFLWQRRDQIDPLTVALGLALTGNLIDLLPNSGLSPISWMLAGALCGRLEKGAEVAQNTLRSSASGPKRGKTSFARAEIESNMARELTASARDDSIKQEQESADVRTKGRTLPYSRNLGGSGLRR